MKKRNPVFALAVLALLLGVLGISFVLYKARLSEELVFQEIVPLGKMKYDEAFLKEAEKIPGIRSVSGVKEIPISLKIGDYTADVIVDVLDIRDFSIKTKSSGTLTLGSAPVLLLGKDSLKGFSDRNGHFLSEKEQEKLLLQYENLPVSCLSAPAGETDQPNRPSNWLPCRIGAVLESPSEGIYLSAEQEKSLSEKADAVPASKILLKVKGEKNFRRALEYFSPS